MRKVTYSAASSFDALIADSSDSYDWIKGSAASQKMLVDFWRTIDTLVMGRKTWEVAVRLSGGGGKSPTYGLKAYVFSRTLTRSPHPDVELVSSDPGEFVRRLKRRKGKGIFVFGGGVLARSLLDAGVIDELSVSVQPVLLGSGTPLFQPMPSRVKLKLKECRPIGNGAVYLLYGVVHARRASRSS